MVLMIILMLKKFLKKLKLRNSDTIGAVAGAVLGAKYGAKNIPEHWLLKTRYPSGTCLKFTKGIDIVRYAERLTGLMK